LKGKELKINRLTDHYAKSLDHKHHVPQLFYDCPAFLYPEQDHLPVKFSWINCWDCKQLPDLSLCPMGKMFSAGGTDNLEVTGILKDETRPGHIKFDIVASINPSPSDTNFIEYLNAWDNISMVQSE